VNSIGGVTRKIPRSPKSCATRHNAPVLLQRADGIARDACVPQSAVNSNDRYALARRAGRVAASRSTATRSAR
jgi:hypothetical protein